MSGGPVASGVGPTDDGIIPLTERLREPHELALGCVPGLVADGRSV